MDATKSLQLIMIAGIIEFFGEYFPCRISSALEDERWTGKFSIIPFYVDICPKARIQGFPIDSKNWFDVGKPETLAKAEAYYASL